MTTVARMLRSRGWIAAGFFVGSLAIAASVVLAAPRPSATPPEATPNAVRATGSAPTPAPPADDRDQAIQDLVAETGTACVGMAFVTVRKQSPEELESLIVVAGGSDRWLTEGAAWVGDLDGAVAAFGGRLVVASADEAWIAVVADGRPARLQLVRMVTPSGFTVWRRLQSVVAAEGC